MAKQPTTDVTTDVTGKSPGEVAVLLQVKSGDIAKIVLQKAIGLMNVEHFR